MNRDQAIPSSGQSISLADEEAVRQVLVETMFGLWDIINDISTGDEAIAVIREHQARWQSSDVVPGG